MISKWALMLKTFRPLFKACGRNAETICYISVTTVNILPIDRVGESVQWQEHCLSKISLSVDRSRLSIDHNG